jgi:hypothetical protein
MIKAATLPGWGGGRPGHLVFAPRNRSRSPFDAPMILIATSSSCSFSKRRNSVEMASAPPASLLIDGLAHALRSAAFGSRN